METLTAASLDALLRALHADRERAAGEYEELRKRLTRLLAWWGSPRASELADETLDRAGRKLYEGAIVPSLGPYVRGIARMVFYESRRGVAEETLAEDVAAPIEDDELQPVLSCLDRCLDELNGDDRVALLAYYDDAGGRQIDARKRLAKQMGGTMNTLRVRVHRLRSRVEACVRECTKRFSAPPHPPAGGPP
jgi:DNA-directed RNA polymerase specialized sigma24 family protein